MIFEPDRLLDAEDVPAVVRIRSARRRRCRCGGDYLVVNGGTDAAFLSYSNRVERVLVYVVDRFRVLENRCN